jgi:hypothetical protein
MSSVLDAFDPSVSSLARWPLLSRLVRAHAHAEAGAIPGSHSESHAEALPGSHTEVYAEALTEDHAT